MTMSRPSRRQFVNALGALAVAPMVGGAKSGRRTSGARAAGRPNIVFILADDLGYGDLSLLGRTEYQTPRIDSIGTGGLLLPEAYANSSVCSPTRFALATGRYQYRLRGGLEEPLGPGEHIGLPPDHPTIASELRRAGYRTALVGKWHMGSLPKYGPLKSGYDRFFGLHGSGADYFTHRSSFDNTGPGSLYDGDQNVERQGYLTDLLSDRAADEIRQAALDRVPLFLSLHYTAPHWPWEGPEDEEVARRLRSLQHYDGGSERTWASMMRAFDQGVGRVLDAIEASGQASNTIVIFTSDNGGERFSRVWPFAGMKGQLLEGGIRVPLLIRWPDRIAPGSRSDQVIASMDFMPTLLAAAGGRPRPDYPPDGLILLPQIAQGAPPVDRPLYWRFKAGEQAAARLGKWKYLKTNGHEYLFDLSADRQERANLSKHHPEIFDRLKQDWHRWNAAMLPYPDGTYSYSAKGKGQVAEYD
jgi:arylsulfatase A-like enzyme